MSNNNNDPPDKPLPDGIETHGDNEESPHLPVSDENTPIEEPDWTKLIFGDEILSRNTILDTHEEYVALIEAYDNDVDNQEWIVSDTYTTFGVSEREFVERTDNGEDDT